MKQSCKFGNVKYTYDIFWVTLYLIYLKFKSITKILAIPSTSFYEHSISFFFKVLQYYINLSNLNVVICIKLKGLDS